MATQYTAGFTPSQVLNAANMNTIGAAPETYTPAWTSTGTAPAIGNGTLTGRYWRFNKFVVAQITWVTGSTTTFGTGAYRLSLPIAADNTGFIAGFAQLTDASTFNTYVSVGGFVTTTTVQIVTNVNGINGVWAQTTPVVQANGDFLSATMLYSVA
jgi:hypothetical protein